MVLGNGCFCTQGATLTVIVTYLCVNKRFLRLSLKKGDFNERSVKIWCWKKVVFAANWEA